MVGTSGVYRSHDLALCAAAASVGWLFVLHVIVLVGHVVTLALDDVRQVAPV